MFGVFNCLYLIPYRIGDHESVPRPPHPLCNVPFGWEFTDPTIQPMCPMRQERMIGVSPVPAGVVQGPQ